MNALLLRPGRSAEYCGRAVCQSVSLSVSLFVCLSVCPQAYLGNRWTDRREIVCTDSRSPVPVARSSSGGVELRCVLPVLWMTSRVAVMGVTPKRGRRWPLHRAATTVSGVAIRGRSLMSIVYECQLFLSWELINFVALF